MAYQSLPIQFKSQEVGATTDFVLVEQEPLDADVGRTSVLQAVLGIQASIYGTAYPLPNCGEVEGVEGACVVLYAYPSNQSLSFSFKLSYGTVLSNEAGVVIREEIVRCDFKEYSTLDYPFVDGLAMEWIGDCFDKYGNITSRPTVTTTGSTLLFSSTVYGSLRVRYNVYRIKYVCSIVPRVAAIANSMSSTAYVFWNGGIDWVQVAIPTDYENTLGACGNGLLPGDVIINPGDTSDEPAPGDPGDPNDLDGPPESAQGANKLVVVGYCSQEVESETITER